MTNYYRDLDQPPNPDVWPVDRAALQQQGKRRRDAGMAAAADAKDLRIRAGKVAMLDALLRSSDGTATIDDATPPDDLREAFADGGCWRGSVTRSLAKDGLIEKVAAGPSVRPSRHAGLRHVWRLTDRQAAIVHRSRLMAAVQAALPAGSLKTMPLAPKSETPPVTFGEASTGGASRYSNPNRKDSSDGQAN